MCAGPEAPAGGPPPLELVVAGGEVLDPSSGLHGRYDIGVAGGKVAAVAPHLPHEAAAQLIDAKGCLVLPGLVDLHTHIFEGATYWGIDPRPVAWRTGVTTWVDAGSAGAYTAAAFRRWCEGLAPLGARAFLNISAVGLVAETGEAQRAELLDAALCAEIIKASEGFFMGVKCRMDRHATGGSGTLALERALGAGEAAGVPVMVHIGEGPPGADEVLELLRPGDIVTHCATGQGMGLFGPDGRPRQSFLEARERGVLFDVGHGSGGFSFAVAEAMLRSGLLPDVVSSDLHQRSVLGPAFDLPTCMSKFLALGMSLEEVVRAATLVPAQVAGTGAGSLGLGQRADLALFELEEGDFVFFDTYLEPRRASQLLVNRATLVSGSVLEPVPPAPPAPWASSTEKQRALIRDVGVEGAWQRPWAERLTTRDCFVPFLKS